MARAPSQRTYEQAMAESEARRSIAEQIGLTVRTLVWAGCVAFIAHCVKESIQALAGRNTETDILVQFLSRAEVSEALAWLLAGGGSLYGYGQNRLKKRTTESLTKRITQLERMVDPSRSTSGLTPRGETRKEDK